MIVLADRVALIDVVGTLNILQTDNFVRTCSHLALPRLSFVEHLTSFFFRRCVQRQCTSGGPFGHWVNANHKAAWRRRHRVTAAVLLTCLDCSWDAGIFVTSPMAGPVTIITRLQFACRRRRALVVLQDFDSQIPKDKTAETFATSKDTMERADSIWAGNMPLSLPWNYFPTLSVILLA